MDDDVDMEGTTNLGNAEIVVNVSEDNEDDDLRECKTSAIDQFSCFGLRPELLKAIVDKGFLRPSSVQNDALPDALMGKDLFCQSKTGSGKTAVFVLSTLNQMEFSNNIETLILVPTRELAIQIVTEYESFGKYLDRCRALPLYGGIPVEASEGALAANQPNILAATPGRLGTLLRCKKISLRHLRHLIVDECDAVIGKRSGMADEVRYIIEQCPEDRQVQMYTATITKDEAERERQFLKLMHCPKMLLVDRENELTLEALLQFRVTVEDDSKKTRKLLDLLDRIDFNQVAIFVNTVDRCSVLCQILEEQNFPALPLHSHMTQEERLENFGKFKDFRRRIIVATDLMGRGIDVEFVTFVINYDIPLEKKVYLHRVGRTGRMERRGLAVSLCASQEDADVLVDVQRSYGVTLGELPQDLDPDAYL